MRAGFPHLTCFSKFRVGFTAASPTQICFSGVPVNAHTSLSFPLTDVLSQTFPLPPLPLPFSPFFLPLLPSHFSSSSHHSLLLLPLSSLLPSAVLPHHLHHHRHTSEHKRPRLWSLDRYRQPQISLKRSKAAQGSDGKRRVHLLFSNNGRSTHRHCAIARMQRRSAPSMGLPCDSIPYHPVPPCEFTTTPVPPSSNGAPPGHYLVILNCSS